MRFFIKNESTDENIKPSPRLRDLLTRSNRLSKSSAIEMKSLVDLEFNIALSEVEIFDKKENAYSYAIDKYYSSINLEV